MKNNTFNISKPCSENWDAMHQDAANNGRFCDSCEKTVVDFTNMSDAEVLAFFENHKGQKICGRMRQNQTNRPFKKIETIENQIIETELRRTTSFGWRTALIGMALTGWLAGSTPVMANFTHLVNSNLEQVENLPDLPKKAVLSGRVLEKESKTPIANVSVTLSNKTGILATVQADSNGVFEFRNIDLDKNKTDLKLNAQVEGFASVEIALNKKNSAKPIEILMEIEYEIMGEVWIDGE